MKKIKILIMPETACKGRKYAVIIYQIVHNYIAYLYEYEKRHPGSIVATKLH